MEEKRFVNSINEDVHFLKWEVSNPNATVVIAHGMVEHPYRYDDLARYLNKNNISVYGIFHIGHGKHAKILNHMGEGEFDRCISNIYELIENIKNESSLPIFLLGHSMGSFMSQIYISRYNNIDGLILSGSTKAPAIAKIGATLAKIMNKLSKDNTKASNFLDGMAFGSYNKKFKNPRTKFDWLSRDEENVDKYIADPYCGGVCSVSFYKNLTSAMANMNKKKYIENINRELPIIILGGSSDPVSSMGKGLIQLKEQYVELGVKDVSMIMYENARHEIYNEINKDEVYKDTLDFINNHI